MTITNALSYGDFDRDHDNLPDWWEIRYGLSANGASSDEYADSDQDGLINLHEYWAGTDPMTPDGSNTLLSVCTRSVDDRIRDIADPGTAVGRFVDFEMNGRNGVFMPNTNFWAKDLDFGCVSVWHGQLRDGSGEKSATAITRRHVVMAAHWADNKYIFSDINGSNHVRTISNAYNVPNTDLLIGRLNEDLPDTISIPKMLSADYVQFIAMGTYLPCVCMTHEKTASVIELETLNCSALNGDNGVVYYLLGKTALTNHVFDARNRIRDVTTDGFSGCPVFLVVNSQLVFLFSKHMKRKDNNPRSPYWGPLISCHLGTIQSKIDTWEGGEAYKYQLNILRTSDFEPLPFCAQGGER